MTSLANSRVLQSISLSAAAAFVAGAVTAPAATASPDQADGTAPYSGTAEVAGSADVFGSLSDGFEPDGVAPDVHVDVLADGLTIPWDVVRTPDGTVLTGERNTGRVVGISPDGTQFDVAADFGAPMMSGESGLMGMTLDRDFSETLSLYTCVAQGGDVNDVRVLRWRVAEDYSALHDPVPIVDGIPVGEGDRHSGCSMTTHPDGSLFVGTGDAASATVPQDLESLGGKVLNITPDGDPGPHAMSRDTIVSTYGHRNVQGLAVRPGSDDLFISEHGPAYDDELNRHVAGGNYGWSPEIAGIFTEQVPMTDLARFPDAVEAVWSSGSARLAPAGAAFVTGEQWGEFDGAVAIGMLRGERILLLSLSDDGTRVEDSAYILVGDHGRIRSLAPEPDGSLLVTTSNGSGSDQVLRIQAG